MGLVERRRRKLVVVRAFAGDHEMIAYLSAYELRHRADRARLQAMMRYAQSLRCRMRTLQEYFGEAGAEDCGRCDACTGSAL